MLNVASWDGRDTIYAAAEAKGDTELLFALSNVSKDLVAAEGKYHRACRAAYVSKANLKHKQFKEGSQEDSFESAMKCLGEKIAPSLSAGKAYCMNSLLEKYKTLLTDRGIDADSYTRQRLKLRLKNFFGESIVFHQQTDRSQPELVYSSELSCRL